MILTLNDKKKIFNRIKNCWDINDLDLIRLKYLGKNGYIVKEIKKLKKMSLKEKKIFGSFINDLKKKIIFCIKKQKQALNILKLKKKIHTNYVDVSLSTIYHHNDKGSIHIITKSINKMKSFFYRLGFSLFIGPEIEDQYYNFESLNIPFNHPSRNKNDTFWINSSKLLRTQTSSMQVRIMEKYSPPIKVIIPGKVYRKDSSSRHSPMFHQLEGFIVDKNVSFSNLKWIIYEFLKDFFKKKISIRFRNSYFPFTVPSFEIDILDKNLKWLEILGCGMIHPKILKNAKIDTEIYSGFAFGIGVERMIMLKYNLTNIKFFFKNHLSFLKQF
ncbi:phenylalanine--tRNA ligase subunit alpha [Buchnera aphidicola]|uniref:phenylalanine--tRNA ligase subunit alpha n=1 Tax=Buchnera aphidicola TaxID=9 RepID=UPI0030EE1EF4